MFTAIVSMVFVSAVIAHKPMLKAIEHVSEKREEKAAKEEAMEIYLHREIMDIEH